MYSVGQTRRALNSSLTQQNRLRRNEKIRFRCLFNQRESIKVGQSAYDRRRRNRPRHRFEECVERNYRGTPKESRHREIAPFAILCFPHFATFFCARRVIFPDVNVRTWSEFFVEGRGHKNGFSFRAGEQGASSITRRFAKNREIDRANASTRIYVHVYL